VRAATSQVVQAVVGALIPATAENPGSDTNHSSQPKPTPTPQPSETASDGHPSPTDHPGATSDPEPGDHPGAGVSDSGENNSSTHADSGKSDPGGAPTDQPTASPRRAGASTKP
jgi:hypothetical protein